MATIGIHINDEIVYNTDVSSYDYTAGYSRSKIRFTIICDGSESLNHFYIASNKNNWVHINRMRNIIDITIDENCGLDYRYDTIQFIHTLDRDTFMSFDIAQEPHEYSISIDNNAITFDNLLDQDDDDNEIQYVNVTAVDGAEDFGIKPVQEFVKSETDTDYHEIVCDNGLKIYKLGTNRLAIQNFGKASLYYDNYYVITVYHVNDMNQTCTITVKYTLDRNSGFELADE